MGEEVTITYETLFEFLRIEKMKEELQVLEPSFLSEAQAYLQEKYSFLHELQQTADPLQVEKAGIQLQNIKRILKDLIDRRERKIVNLALMKSRASQLLIDERAFLEQEKVLFRKLCEELGVHHRTMLNLAIPDPGQPRLSHAPELSQAAPLNVAQNAPSAVHKGSEVAADTSGETGLQPLEEEPETEPLETEALVDAPQALTAPAAVRFLHAVPKFVGTDMQVYGPFDVDDVAKLPPKLAEILIKKGRAEPFDQPETDEENENNDELAEIPTEA